MNDRPSPDRAALRALPAIDALVDLYLKQTRADGARPGGAGSASDPASHSRLTRAAREVVAAARAAILRGERGPERDSTWVRALEDALDAARAPAVTRVINATGVLLHTNLGRAPLSVDACAAILDAAGASTVELDLATGKRGPRAERVHARLAELSSAEAALVVNNCAAAVLLAIAALGAGRDVVVSRGELVEIGGSYRVPDVVAQGGARLREVGTTNRTRAQDYAAVIDRNTAVLLKTHASNFTMAGFVEEAPLSQLAELARATRAGWGDADASRRGEPAAAEQALRREEDVPEGPWVVEDLGSATFLPLDSEGALGAPHPAASIAAGADLVCFSGDKLFGGPQAGLIVGGRGAVERLRRHPLFRAMRPSKLVYAALDATLLAHLDGDWAAIPLHRMTRASLELLERRGNALADAVSRTVVSRAMERLDGGQHKSPRAAVGSGASTQSSSPGRSAAGSVRVGPWQLETAASESTIGGGSLPGQTLASAALRIARRDGADAGRLAERLRTPMQRGILPVLGTLRDGALWLDLRTVDPSDDARLAEAVALGIESGTTR